MKYFKWLLLETKSDSKRALTGCILSMTASFSSGQPSHASRICITLFLPESFFSSSSGIGDRIKPTDGRAMLIMLHRVLPGMVRRCAHSHEHVKISPETDRPVPALLPGTMCCGQDLHQCTSIKTATMGIRLNRVKSWSATVKTLSGETSTAFPQSTAATG